MNLKKSRLKLLKEKSNFKFQKLELSSFKKTKELFQSFNIGSVIHLAAQAGVRYSIENPHAYTKSNIEAFLNILECSKDHTVEHLTFASTSSVYGANLKIPFAESDPVDHPLQFYAATKRANELMAHSYANLFSLPCSGVRFFTVYGPWGRPDMALFLFTKKIINNEPIDVFNYGNHTRDFTYVDDIVRGLYKIHIDPPLVQKKDIRSISKPDESFAPYRIVNIGNNNPTNLSRYIEALENALEKKAVKNMLPLQPGDVEDTYADVSKLVKKFGYKPSVSVEDGVKNFVAWYKTFYKSK